MTNQDIDPADREPENIQQLIDAREQAEEDLAELRKLVKALLDALDKGALLGDGSSENNGEADELGELAIADLRKEMERENETD